ANCGTGSISTRRTCGARATASGASPRPTGHRRTHDALAGLSRLAKATGAVFRSHAIHDFRRRPSARFIASIAAIKVPKVYTPVVSMPLRNRDGPPLGTAFAEQ